jgi:hypothetical protein
MAKLSSAARRAVVFVSTIALASAFLAPARAEIQATGAPVARYASVLRSFNPQLTLVQSKDMATHVLLLSSYYGLDPRLLVAIVGVESSWRSRAISSVGAQGLGQLMPGTAGVLDVLAFDAYENLDGTARYLRRMMQQYAALGPEARAMRAIASYNAGPGAVARAGGIPAIPETQKYVLHVMDLWRKLEGQLPGTVALPVGPQRAPERIAPAPPAVAVAPVTSHPGARVGSVADFTQLEVRSMEAFAAAAPGTPPPAAATPQVHEKRGLRRWIARAFYLK